MQPEWEQPVLHYDARYDVLVALKERIQASEHASYVLVDPMSRCDLNTLDALQRKKYAVDLERFGMDRDLCPYILRIEDAYDELLKESLDIAWERRNDWQQPQPICGWITSELQAPALAGALLRRAVTSKAGCARHLDRFYDPRVARHAGYSQTSRWVFPEAVAWSQLGWDGVLSDLPCNEDDADSLKRGFFENTHAEWCVPVTAAIAQLQAEEVMSHEKECALQSAAQAAMSLGLSAAALADATTFLLHKVLIHSQIEQHPIIRAWLREAIDGTASYADHCTSADRDWWEAVEKGAWMSAMNEVKKEIGHG